jgi:hypothetical protein
LFAVSLQEGDPQGSTDDGQNRRGEDDDAQELRRRDQIDPSRDAQPLARHQGPKEGLDADRRT